MTIQTWVDILISSLQNLWLQLASFLPSLVGAMVVFLVGLVVATGVEKIIEKVVHHLRLDTLLRRLGLEPFLQRAGFGLDAGYFFGRITYWFVVLAFSLTASDILGFSALSRFIGDVLYYIPNVVVAALIMIVTLIAANFVRSLTAASVLGARIHRGRFLVSLAWWVIFVFGLLVSLAQLGVASTIIETVITGLIAMLALAGGLAFGLGGKDTAARILDKARSEWEHH